MNLATQERVQLVRGYCERHKATPSKTLAKIIYANNGAAFSSLEAVRSAIRYVRGNCGESNRKRLADKTLSRTNGVAGTVYKMPESKCEPWQPFVLDSQRTLVLSDIHIPFHDSIALTAAVKRGKEFAPDCVLLNGDVCDFFSVSRFDKNPTRSKLVDEINDTRQFLGWMRQEFPKARIIYKYGNHDEWLEKYVWRKSPELFGIEALELRHLVTDARENEPAIGGIEFVTDQRRIQYGKLTILHGHELGKGSIAPPVNPARGAFVKTLECSLVGHLHRTSQHSETSLNGRLVSCWSTGCLCGLWPEYARVNKWDHSFTLLELHDGGQFSVLPVRLLKGAVL